MRVYDHAGVPEPVWKRAEIELLRRFVHAGVQVSVTLCMRMNEFNQACNLPPGSSEFHLAVVPDVPAEIAGRRIPRETCGFAIVRADSQASRRATIFYSCVRRTADTAQLTPGVILGNLIAHELAHLLLDTGQHAEEGILRIRLREKEWQLAAQGRLGFSGEEAKRLRAAAALRARMPGKSILADKAKASASATAP